MLTAISNGKNVLAKTAKRENDYYCPGCFELLILKKGEQNLPHFAHRRNSSCSLAINESAEHEFGKFIIKQQLESIYKGVEMEKYFAAIKQRADVATAKFIFEFQCSFISSAKLKERVKGYRTINKSSLWILGPPYFAKRATANCNLQFLRYKNTVGYYLLYFLPGQGNFILRFRICLVDDRLEYSERRFRHLSEVFSFLRKEHRSKLRVPSRMKLTRRIETRVRRGDTGILPLVNYCYEQGRLLTGFPNLAFQMRILPPLFTGHTLDWKLFLLVEGTKQKATSDDQLIAGAQAYFPLRNNFVFINNFKQRQTSQMQTFLMLIKGKKVIWFSDVHAKMKRIKEENGGENMTDTKQLPKRDEVNPKLTWDLTTIFKDHDAFEVAFKQLNDDIIKYKSADHQINGPRELQDSLEKLLGLNRRFEKIFVYAQLENDSDTKNPVGQDDIARTETLGSNLGQATSWFEPGVLLLGKQKFTQYCRQNPELKQYERLFEEIFQKEGHVLPPEQEKLLAKAAPIFTVPEKTFDILDSSNLKFPKVKNEEGETIQLSDGVYSTLMQSTDRQVRQDMLLKAFILPTGNTKILLHRH